MARPEDPEHLHRTGDAAQDASPDRHQVEVALDKVFGGVADDHGARLRLGLETGGHVGRRPHDVRGVHRAGARCQSADHDGAGMDTHPDGDIDAVLVAQLDAGDLHPLDQAESGQHRPPGVVLVHVGVAEAGNDPVTLELQDATIQFLGRRRGRTPVPGEDVVHDLRFGQLGQVCRSHDVREDQGDERPLTRRERLFGPGPVEQLRRRAGWPDQRPARHRPAR